MESNHYQRALDLAWKSDRYLMPYGEKLCKEAFDEVDYCDFEITIEELEDNHECHVKSTSGGRTFTVQFPKAAVEGSRFGDCTCCEVQRQRRFPANTWWRWLNHVRLRGWSNSM